MSLLCLNDLRVRGAEKDLAAAVAGRNSYIETKESKMELSWKQRDPRWNPRWNSDGSRGIRDVIQDGAQMEAKEAKEAKEAMESQMELRWSSDGVQTEFRRKRRKPRLPPKIESKQSK